MPMYVSLPTLAPETLRVNTILSIDVCKSDLKSTALLIQKECTHSLACKQASQENNLV